MIAIEDNLKYLIECKSSNTPGDVLKSGSENFLKSMLEFVALQNLAESAKWQYRYLLVVNIDVSKDIIELFTNRSAEQVKRVVEKLKDFGTREYGNKFNANLVSTDIMQRTLDATTILTLPDQYLRERYRSDIAFKQQCENYQARWRIPRSGLLPNRGVLISKNSPRINFLCKSETHENCSDQTVNDFVCHIGNLAGLFRKIRNTYEKLGSPVCCLIGSKELGYLPSNIEADEKASSKDVASVLSIILNDSYKPPDCGLTFLVVPGTFDIVVANTGQLAKLVRSVYDPISNKYDLRKIPEIEGVGLLVKILLARDVLRREYKLITCLDDYTAGDDNADFIID